MTMGQIICPNCKTSNLEFAVRCRNCGERLDIVRNPARIVETEDVRLNEIRAIEEQVTYKPEDTNDQTERVKPVLHIETARLNIDLDQDDEIRYGTLKMDGDLILTDLRTKTEFHVPHAALAEVVIGRYDSAKDYSPLVDLDKVDGRAGGVSRVHATMSWKDDVLGIVDHDSKNGTFLNGKRLVPDQKRVVRDGDVISFGKIELQVQFKKGARRRATGI